MTPSALEALHNALGGVVSGPSREDSEALAEQLEDSGWTLCPTVEAAKPSSPESPIGTPRAEPLCFHSSGCEPGCASCWHGAYVRGTRHVMSLLYVIDNHLALGNEDALQEAFDDIAPLYPRWDGSEAEPAGASSATREDEA